MQWPFLTFNIFERGDAGVRTSNFVTNIGSRIDEYEQTIGATVGFESVRCSFVATLEEALDWLRNGLMRSVVVAAPDTETIWEGFLETIEVDLGQERRSVSVAPIANRVKARYTTILGSSAATSILNDTASQALYGIKVATIRLGVSDSGSAANEATVQLAFLKNPRAVPSSECTTAALGQIRVTLIFAGWYTTLEWETTSNTTTSTATTVPTQVATLHGLLANPFIAATYASVTGVAMTQYIAPDTTFKTAIEDRLRKGDGTNRFAWGCYRNYSLYIDAWAGATPTTINYRRMIGEPTVYDADTKMPIYPWNLWPNKMYEVIELLDVASVATAADTAARYCIERVVLTMNRSGYSVRLEPTAFDSVDVRLAKIEALWGDVV